MCIYWESCKLYLKVHQLNAIKRNNFQINTKTKVLSFCSVKQNKSQNMSDNMCAAVYM